MFLPLGCFPPWVECRLHLLPLVRRCLNNFTLEVSELYRVDCSHWDSTWSLLFLCGLEDLKPIYKWIRSSHRSHYCYFTTLYSSSWQQMNHKKTFSYIQINTTFCLVHKNHLVRSKQVMIGQIKGKVLNYVYKKITPRWPKLVSKVHCLLKKTFFHEQVRTGLLVSMLSVVFPHCSVWIHQSVQFHCVMLVLIGKNQDPWAEPSQVTSVNSNKIVSMHFFDKRTKRSGVSSFSSTPFLMSRISSIVNNFTSYSSASPRVLPIVVSSLTFISSPPTIV